LTPLRLRAWKERLLDVAADRCIRQSRRDPRDSAPVEQALFDQLDSALESCRQGQLAELVIQAETWFQNLLFCPDEFIACCAPLVDRTRRAVVELVDALDLAGPPAVVLMTAAAGRLPGLPTALEESLPLAPVVEDAEN